MNDCWHVFATTEIELGKEDVRQHGNCEEKENRTGPPAAGEAEAIETGCRPASGGD